MPLEFHIHKNIAYFTTEGDVEFEEGTVVLLNGLDEIRRKDIHQVLFDIRFSTENRTSNEVRSIADLVKKHIVGGKLAMVANEGLYFGLSRMFASHMADDGFYTEAFQELEKALAWLEEW